MSDFKRNVEVDGDTVDMNKYCRHAHYSDAHCGEMGCLNYFSRCPKHAYSGRKTEKCSHEYAEHWND